MVGGMLSRQANEAQFVLRRRAWYRALTDMSDELKLLDLILAEQLLNNASLTEDQKLMIRTTLSGNVTFNGVAQELVNKHPRIHEKQRFAPRQQERGQRPYSWNWGKGKNYGHGKPQRLAFYQNAEDDYGEYFDEDYTDTSYDLAAYYGYTNDEEHDPQQYEAGDLVEEGLAML